MSTVELKPWVLVNGLLCRTEQARDMAIELYRKKGEDFTLQAVPQDAKGGYILSVTDPMEQ